MIAVVPSFQKIVTGSLPPGTDTADVVLRIEIAHQSITALLEISTFKQYLQLTEFNFVKPLNQDQQASAFEHLYLAQDLFNQSYKDVFVGLPVFPELVPVGFEMHLGGDSQTNKISESMISSLNTNDKIFAAVKSLIPGAQVTDVHTTFLKQVLHLPAGIYVLVNTDTLTIAAIEHPGKLQLLNKYEYQTVEDFMYFLLLVCDELKTDRTKIPLVLCGKILRQSKIYDACYQYFSTIIFLNPDNGKNYSKALKDIPKHLHFTLYSLFANQSLS